MIKSQIAVCYIVVEFVAFLFQQMANLMKKSFHILLFNQIMYHKKKKVKNPNNTLKQKDKVDCIALWDTVFNNVLCCILVTVSNVAGHPGILFI